MNKDIIRSILSDTGISFELRDLGTANHRLNIEFKDLNLPIGEGYSLKIQIGETRGVISLEFESFSKFLLEKSKDLLISNIETLRKFNVDGDIYIKGKDEAKSKIDSFDVSEISKNGSFEVLFESSMRDLRKNNELNDLFLDLAKIAQLLIFTLLPYEVEAYGEVEGKKFEVITTKYERSRKNRALCLAYFGSSCQICAFNFEATYGEQAKDYIHVHHIEQVSDLGEARKINPLTELIPLCPNCHAVAHLRNPPYSPRELRDMIKRETNE